MAVEHLLAGFPLTEDEPEMKTVIAIKFYAHKQNPVSIRHIQVLLSRKDIYKKGEDIPLVAPHRAVEDTAVFHREQRCFCSKGVLR
jgi:hypothetical protein